MAIWLVLAFCCWQHPQPVFTYIVIGFGEATTLPTVSVGDTAELHGMHTLCEMLSVTTLQGLLQGQYDTVPLILHSWQ
jgi:hypothetical protein